jgi:hypothetical protein
MSQWEVRHRLPAFNVVLPVNSKQTFYLRFASRTMIRLPLMLWSPKALTDYSQSENLGWGVFFGLMLMMFSYNVTFYFLTRERSYLLFSGTVLAYAFYLAALDGWTSRLWPDSALNRLAYAYPAGGCAFLFLPLRSWARDSTSTHHRAFKCSSRLPPALIPLLDITQPFPAASYGPGDPCTPLVLLAGSARWRRGYRTAAISCSHGSSFCAQAWYSHCCRLVFG